MRIRMYNVDNRWCVQFEYVVNRTRVMLSSHTIATMTVRLRRFDRGGLLSVFVTDKDLHGRKIVLALKLSLRVSSASL